MDIFINTKDFSDLFDEINGEFTVFIVEKKFAVNYGYDYFKQYHNTPNFISTDYEAESFISTINKWITKKIPNVANLIQSTLIESKPDLPYIIDNLFKLFGTHQHEAAGPEVIDPIIIQENKVTKEQIGQIVSLHKNSLLRPKIIIILANNDFVRAEKLLSFSPTGTRIKFIRNDLTSKSTLVLNEGADNIDVFIDIYSKQCFSACSRTKTDLLYNEEWAENSNIKRFSPLLLQIRTKLLYGEKLSALDSLNTTINKIKHCSTSTHSENDKKLLLSLEGMSKIFRIFCNDTGGKDMEDALKISSILNNDLFTAHINRYSFFMNNIDFSKKDNRLKLAKEVFEKNNVMDHSIYCQNNLLTGYFYNRSNNIIQFNDMINKAISDVPGLVGMPIIYNNSGVAYMLNSEYEKALNLFTLGLKYFPQNDHKLGLQTNILIAKTLAGLEVTEQDVRNVLMFAITNLSDVRTSFLSAPDILNLILICSKNKLDINILENKQALQVLANSVKNGYIAQSSFAYHLTLLQDIENINIPFNFTKNNSFSLGSRRQKFMEFTGYNPAIFYSWL